MVTEKGYSDMAIGRFFKSLVNSEVMGEEIVKSIIQLYEQTARYSPGDSTHDLLLKTYLARLKARRININDERVLLNAMVDIQLPAQLPEGQNIKALALYCLFKERPDIINLYPKFAAEYRRLMAPIQEGSSFDDGDMDVLKISYEQNSRVPEEVTKTNFVCPSCGCRSRIPKGRVGVVTCPDCQLKTSIDHAGNSVAHDGDSTEALITEENEISNKSENDYEESAEKYAAQKKNNHLYQFIAGSESHEDKASVPSKIFNQVSIEWLRENAEYFEQKKKKGRELSDYERDLIEQYKSILEKGGSKIAD